MTRVLIDRARKAARAGGSGLAGWANSPFIFSQATTPPSDGEPTRPDKAPGVRHTRRPSIFGALLIVASLYGLSGCQTTTVSTAAPKPTVRAGNQPPPFQGNVLESLDPCGDRMQNLCGPLTGYFSVYHHGPSKLEDLAPFAIVGEPLAGTCPVSGKPYVFAPDGLEASGQNIRIYVYDAEPSHHGARSCVIMQGAAAVNQPVILFEHKIPEDAFRRFKPATPLLR